MKKKVKLPTILGIFILIFGIIAGVTLINSKQIFKIGATIESTPKNVRVSNITKTSATVTWTTDTKSKGFVRWGKSELALSKISLEEENDPNFVHSVNVVGIEEGGTALFKINSDGKDYDNGGLPWNIKTNSTPVSQNSNLIASGSILESDGSTPAKAIIYLTINGEVASALTSSEGNFVVPLSNYFAKIEDTSPIEISVHGGPKGTTQGIIYPKSVKFIPTMILGRSYDFRSAEINNSNQLPESSLTIPQSIEASSRFEVIRNNEPKETVSTLSIDSIVEGEIITTVDPEFFGTAPKGAQIEIQIESELQTGTVTVDSKGNWKWSPPNNLEVGEHKLTASFRDATGVVRKITRTFVVSAAEGPAFESSSSGSLATPTPTPVPVVTSTPSSSPIPVSSTPASTPETGSLTPTISLFIMGIGVLISSIFVYKKEYAN